MFVQAWYTRIHFVGTDQSIGVEEAPQQIMGRSTSTTLADLLTPPLGAHPFSTMRASLRRQSSEEFDDCVAHGGQSWLRRRAGDSFFSASLLRDGGAGGRRKRSLSSARDGEALARIAPRSDRDRVLLSAAGEPARKSNVP